MKLWDQHRTNVSLALPVLARSAVAHDVLLGGGALEAFLGNRGWVARFHDGYARGEREKFRRRSDAKRWLLAIAAGLKSVPRQTMREVAAAHGNAFMWPDEDDAPAQVHACGAPLARTPRGWRCEGRFWGDSWAYERNRRRR